MAAIYDMPDLLRKNVYGILLTFGLPELVPVKFGGMMEQEAVIL